MSIENITDEVWAGRYLTVPEAVDEAIQLSLVTEAPVRLVTETPDETLRARRMLRVECEGSHGTEHPGCYFGFVFDRPWTVQLVEGRLP